MSIFLSCGEVSGDNYLALLIKSLKGNGFNGALWGMLGPQSEGAGGLRVWSYQELHLMGFLEVLPSIPRLIRLKNAMVRKILSELPETVVVVDSPDFHLPLVKSLRRSGFSGAIVYLVPPTVWAWREGRCSILAEYCDLCLPLLSFENDFLLGKGVNSKWKGHPMLESLKNFTPPAGIVKETERTATITLLPGSRPGEIKRHLPVLLECASRISDLSLKPVFSISSTLPEGLKREMKKKISPWDFHEGSGRDIMSLSRAVIGVSGTVSVESMFLDRFMIVIYRGAFFSWFIYKLFISAPYISIPNIMADEMVFPEYLQQDVNVDNIIESLKKYVFDEAYSARVHEILSDLKDRMGAEGACDFWARCILEISGQ